MTRGPDLVSIVEAAYRTDLDDAAWLSNVCEQTDAVLGRGLGTGGYFLDSSNPRDVRVWGFAKSHLHCPIDFEATVSLAEPLDFQAFLSRQAVGTGSGQLGERRWRRRPLYRAYEAAGARDVIGIVALDANRDGCVLAVPTRDTTHLRRPEVCSLLEVAAHLAAAHRLRSRMDRAVSRAADSPGVEAVLSEDGTVVHAEEPAKTPSARESLRRLAVEIDHARSTMRHTDPGRALEVWTALVSGRWTLLDHFDTDGRRYWLAHCNEPCVAEPRALTSRERQVVAYAALGRSNKLIAYQLGLSPSTVACHLGTAMSKLGVHRRAELVAFLAHLVEAAVRVP